MKYIESSLMVGERIVYRAELHWAIYLPGILMVPLFGIGLFVLLLTWIEWISTELAVTNKRVICKTGWISRDIIELNLAKVETIKVDQSMLGRLLGYGSVKVVGTGGTKERFEYIVDPLTFRRIVQEQSH